MNTMRLIAIALPMTLLLACGGGGGSSGTTVTRTPTMTPPAGGPTTPPTPMVTLETLPAALITNETTARGYISGSSAPTITDSTAIQTAFQMEAREAGTLLASDDNVTIGSNTFMFSLEEIRKGAADRFNLTGFDSRYSPVMDHQRVMLAQYRAAGRTDDNDVLEYQSYGGWLTESAFSIDILTIDDGSNESSALVGVSYGDASDSRPTSGSGRWGGSMVGRHKTEDYLVQGSANIRINSFADNALTILSLFNIKRLDTGASVPNLDWTAVPIDANGNFISSDRDVKGTFYGNGHTEIGGTFDKDGIIGAFGGPRQ